MNKKIILILIAVLVLCFIFYLYKTPKETYKFNSNSFTYSNREKPLYQLFLKEKNNSCDIYNINFETRNFIEYKTKIYGLLFIPNKENSPGIVFLPGGGATKEAASHVSLIMCNLGYAVITIDQRGIGQTGGYYLGLEQDYEVFSQGKEPIQHLSVYDALKSFDVLREIKQVDKNNIAIAGESMGGRYALIAASLDKRLKGVIGISTSGFGIKNENLPYTPYLLSIDPDHYVQEISPNKLVMIHCTNDSVIPLNTAKNTFALAKEPKRFYTVEGCQHGYSDVMLYDLKQALEFVLRE